MVVQKFQKRLVSLVASAAVAADIDNKVVAARFYKPPGGFGDPRHQRFIVFKRRYPNQIDGTVDRTGRPYGCVLHGTVVGAPPHIGLAVNTCAQVEIAEPTEQLAHGIVSFPPAAADLTHQARFQVLVPATVGIGHRRRITGIILLDLAYGEHEVEGVAAMILRLGRHQAKNGRCSKQQPQNILSHRLVILYEPSVFPVPRPPTRPTGRRCRRASRAAATGCARRGQSPPGRCRALRESVWNG